MNTNEQIAKNKAWKYAEADFYYGMKLSLAEWGIREGSAMATWYWQRRKELSDRPKGTLKEAIIGMEKIPQPHKAKQHGFDDQ